MSVVEFIVGDEPDHHPEGETLVYGVGETSRGMMGTTPMTVTRRLRTAERERERENINSTMHHVAFLNYESVLLSPHNCLLQSLTTQMGLYNATHHSCAMLTRAVASSLL